MNAMDWLEAHEVHLEQLREMLDELPKTLEEGKEERQEWCKDAKELVNEMLGQ